MADELDKIKQIVNGNQSNVNVEFNSATAGLNLDQTVNQIPKGSLTYALNATVENFDANSVNYQNEPGNELCFNFPEGYQLIGTHAIFEKDKHIFFLANPETKESEIGYMSNNDCIYLPLVNATCLNFNINHPIQKVVHKITSCTTEIYWTDGLNPRRYLDIDNIPYIQTYASDLCDPQFTNKLDCNQLELQPNFSIPQLEVVNIGTGGDLTAGTYQFSIQYSDANGFGYSSYYSVTNPTPIADPQLTTPNFNYQVGRSIDLSISNLDVTGQWQYYNLAVIKTINAITSVELVGTYFIDEVSTLITYTGQNPSQIRLTIEDIFEKFPFYEVAQDVTMVRDVLVWDQLTTIDKVNYQRIANQITLQWQSYRIPNTETYADALNATNLRGYMRDEVYAFEIVFLLKNGKQTDGFHIPGRTANGNDLFPVSPTNNDFIGEPDPLTGTSPWWKIYNGATVEGFSPEYVNTSSYKGNYQFGNFAYWESTDTYPCNELVWGDLSNQPIRHHKFPDALISPIFESAIFSSPGQMTIQKDAIYPIGVKVDLSQIAILISSSSLTQSEKDNIEGFKIVRGDRSTNRSIVAKGMLRNVGKYDREGTEYYYPNYPYNDLSTDPFLLTQSNAYTANAELGGNAVCRNFSVTVTEITAPTPFVVEYIDCYTNTLVTKEATSVGETLNFCCLDFPAPRIISGKGCFECHTYKIYEVIPVGSFSSATFNIHFPTVNGDPTTPCGSVPYSSFCDYCTLDPTPSADCCTQPPNKTLTTMTGATRYNSLVIPEWVSGAKNYNITEVGAVGYDICVPKNLDGFTTDGSKYRHVFNSPETSFGQPFLGTILKLENVMFGAGRAHFVQVRKNALYKMISKEAQQDALISATNIAVTTGTLDASALFAAYQAYLTIFINAITRRNYAYSFNSIGSYDYSASIDNVATSADGVLGIKQRQLDIAQYLIPGVQSVGDDKNINNWQRESSVYLKTDGDRPPLPFPDRTPSIAPSGVPMVTDDSRFVLSEKDCSKPEEINATSVVSYYASLKNQFVNQWGQIYSYNTIDTGFQRDITPILTPVYDTVFGGDTFISKFALKTKLPFFIDNRVGAPDDSDIYYDEIGNVAYPEYWFSARSVVSNANTYDVTLRNFISFKAHNFDCPNSQTPETNPGRTYYDGKMYLFAYGIPYFYCESGYNVDLRQAFNNKEGDFWPHVSTDIPDDWVQESNVSIAQDNTYYYNTTFSKQNKENFFSHLPINWTPEVCKTVFPFRAIYSDEQIVDAGNNVNNWLIYRAVSYFDFPQNYGNLTSLDGIENKAVLARFDNKSLLYNTLLTINTSNPKAAYIGNSQLFSAAPAIDFAETDLGYVGSQHKMLLKIPQGQITIDAKRGQIFLIAGNQATDLTGFGSGMNRWFTEHLNFEIIKYFPTVNTDNHFTGVGLHGVFDSKYDRIIITKLDYIPRSQYIIYNDIVQKYYLKEIINNEEILTEVYLTDLDYFCNKSWTLSFSFNTKSWTSFHSYIPNWYVGENNFFYSGLNDCCGDIDAIVAEVIPEPSTTTTTTTVLDCRLAGTIFVYNCNLAGTASPVVPSTTTTTTTVLYCNLDGSAQEVPSTTTTTTTLEPTTTTTTSSSSTTTTTTSSSSTTTTTTTQDITQISILVVDMYDNTSLDVCAYIDTAGVTPSGNIVSAVGALNFYVPGDTAANAYLLSSDNITPSPSLTRRFEWNINRLHFEYPNQTTYPTFTLQVRGRADSVASVSGVYALKFPNQTMTMTGSLGSYIPSVTPAGGPTPTSWSSNVISGANGTVGTSVGDLILTFVYVRATNTITVTTY